MSQHLHKTFEVDRERAGRVALLIKQRFLQILSTHLIILIKRWKDLVLCLSIRLLNLLEIMFNINLINPGELRVFVRNECNANCRSKLLNTECPIQTDKI